MLEDQLAWYVAGPLLGLSVVACRALFNGHLGVTGGVSELVAKLGSGSRRFDWRGWFVIGIVAGGALFALLVGGRTIDGYGWMTQRLDGAAQLLIAPILLAAGVLIGYGAKAAGGCTSGNGLTGTSMLSPASLVATATFFSTAIAVSFLVEAVTG